MDRVQLDDLPVAQPFNLGNEGHVSAPAQFVGQCIAYPTPTQQVRAAQELHVLHVPILRLPADIGAHMNHSLAVLRFAFSCLLADLTRNYRRNRP